MDKFIKYRVKRLPKKFYSIKEIEYKYHIYFSEEYDDIKEIIIDIFNKLDIDETQYDLEDPYILNVIAFFYGRIQQNYDKEWEFFYRSAKMKNKDAILNIGSFLIEDGEYTRALRYFKKYEGDPYPLVDFQIGFIYHQINDYSKALEYYRKAQLKVIDFESEYFIEIPLLTDYISEVEYKLYK